jgi:hypothetical protein
MSVAVYDPKSVFSVGFLVHANVEQMLLIVGRRIRMHHARCQFPHRTALARYVRCTNQDGRINAQYRTDAGQVLARGWSPNDFLGGRLLLLPNNAMW